MHRPTAGAEAPGAQPREGKRKPALAFIFATVFIDMLGFGLVIPVLPVMVSTLAGVSLAEATALGGWIIMSFAIAQFLCAPLLGNLSDRHGRRPVLLLSMAGHGIAYLIAAAAGSIAMLLAGRVLAGMTGASYSTAYAYIADITSPEHRAQNFGLVGVAFGLGFIFGPALGGVLGEVDFRLPFLFAAGLSAANFLFGLLILPESLPPARRRAFEWRRANPLGALREVRAMGPMLIRLAMVLALWMLSLQALHGIWSYYSAYRYGWSPLQVGLSLAVVGLLAIAVNGLLVRQAVARLGEARTAALGLTAGMASFLVYAFAARPEFAFLGIAVGALGGLILPALQALMTARAPATSQGELQGAVASISSLCTVIGPPMFAQIFTAFTTGSTYAPGAPYVLAALLAASGLVLFVHTTRPFASARPA